MSDNRKLRYTEKMKNLGFKKRYPYVHDDDWPEVFKLIEEKRKARLKILKKKP